MPLVGTAPAFVDGDEEGGPPVVAAPAFGEEDEEGEPVAVEPSEGASVREREAAPPVARGAGAEPVTVLVMAMSSMNKTASDAPARSLGPFSGRQPGR
ncbi:hypothetical protein ACFWV1_33405 [Streptomyces sp. NPDC058700]|uniref:hypothetical protein n=1 Tax=Streptomyces sp. NPDC058700 TaxID=3346607 RepID=UPI003664FDFE